MTPDKYTNQELMLDVGSGHQIYVQDWGKKDAKLPIFILHGGPGTGNSNGYRQRFDPIQERVIFHDQRGSGNSLPKGALAHNSTKDLVDDIEKIAQKLHIEKFIITGGSWGSTLALAYALKYPTRVHSMVLSGIWTGNKKQTEYLTQGRYREHFPEVWQKLLENTPAEHHDDPSTYHINRVLEGDEAARKESAYVYTNVEGPLLKLDDRYEPYPFDDFDPIAMIIELQYMAHNCFMPENYILDNAAKLTMPIWIVQGRYDFVCPPVNAYELHEKLPNSQLQWVQSGHGNDRNTYEVIRSLLLQISKGD